MPTSASTSIIGIPIVDPAVETTPTVIYSERDTQNLDSWSRATISISFASPIATLFLTADEPPKAVFYMEFSLPLLPMNAIASISTRYP